MGSARFTVDKASPKFPASTVVGAYDALAVPGGDAQYAMGTTPAATATVSATGVLTFAGLDYNRRYFAAATVDGVVRSLSFYTSPDPLGLGQASAIILGAAQAYTDTQISALDITQLGTGDNAELVTQLPVGNPAVYQGQPGYAPIQRKTVFSLTLPTVTVGDLIVVTADAEFTNDVGQGESPARSANVLLTTRILLAADSGPDTAGFEIAEENGSNITPDAHHYSPSRSGMLRVTATSRKTVNFIAYAGTSIAQRRDGDVIAVEQDYGRMSVMRIPAALMAA